ncbi:hypothetical protein THRCLA_20575 [Thraustotheca clavata]|uniref:Uncharacterized protein n=1 Tax=Thraustotheca clavata TaxID=74557 RepID=A0A1W0A5N8_9STRA|nr:hypothetical protein THRCLA_20575 [Thraustotheca clavata]
MKTGQTLISQMDANNTKILISDMTLLTTVKLAKLAKLTDGHTHLVLILAMLLALDPFTKTQIYQAASNRKKLQPTVKDMIVYPASHCFIQSRQLVKTEVIEDCYRDLQNITTYGGVVFSHSSNDMFLDGWGDDSGNDKIISWYFPTENDLGELDEYLTSVNEIEKKLMMAWVLFQYLPISKTMLLQQARYLLVIVTALKLAESRVTRNFVRKYFFS